MEKLIASLLLVVAVPGFSRDFVEKPITAYCMNPVDFSNMILEFGEEPLLVGTSFRTINDKEHDFPMVVFVNRQTTSWTMAEKVNSDTYCVIGIGDNFKPYVK